MVSDEDARPPGSVGLPGAPEGNEVAQPFSNRPTATTPLTQRRWHSRKRGFGELRVAQLE